MRNIVFLLPQVPHIAMFCQEQETQLLHSSLTGVVPTHLLPLVVRSARTEETLSSTQFSHDHPRRFLTDTNSQVRKTSQAALLVLLEQGLVDTHDVVDQVTCIKEKPLLSASV